MKLESMFGVQEELVETATLMTTTMEDLQDTLQQLSLFSQDSSSLLLSVKEESKEPTMVVMADGQTVVTVLKVTPLVQVVEDLLVSL